MSEASVMHAAGAADIEAEAADWLQRRHFWNWRAEDQAALDIWLAASMAHSLAYWRLEAAWDRTERLEALRSPETAPAPRRWNRSATLKIAAAIACVAVIGAAAAQYLLAPRDRTFTTPLGGREVVSFADGTKIELNTDTVLRARMTTGQRTIWLDKGEVYFQVKHDGAHPFVVFAGDHRITDLGTKFLVRRDPGRLEVALMEGRVRFGAVDALPKSKSALLMPGDVVTATASTMFVTHKSVPSLAHQLGWQHGMLVFDNMTLADAANEFNRYNQRKLVIDDPSVARLTIVGTFHTTDVKAFIDVAQDVFKLRVEPNGNEIVISR
ncbi:MAG TPA: FecR domain-containing protein [Rhizomicrobium sp.]|nr:FecR domain-containing protein [Rhizomicrobium sp.]